MGVLRVIATGVIALASLSDLFGDGVTTVHGLLITHAMDNADKVSVFNFKVIQVCSKK